MQQDNFFPTEKPVLVTCALPYANGECHLGHLRTYFPGDTYVRLLRRLGQKVLFICGSDTHGTPIVLNAEKEGITPQELFKKYHEHFKGIFNQLNIHFDYYGHTDMASNHVRTQQIINTLAEKGYIYSKKIGLSFCPNCKKFLPDRFVKGTCPYCNTKGIRGDECDLGCGRYLDPGEILEPHCAICDTPTKMVEQEHYFFKLTAFTEFLKKYLANLEGTKIASNYALGWIKQGLKDWNITRNLDWGVKFPLNENLVVYVWLDAPIGYMAFTEEWAKEQNKPEEWKKYWKNKDARIIHFIGSDIVYHHCVFWPALLKGSDYTLPWMISASGMLTVMGQKFSKSRGNVVWVKSDYLDQGLHPDYLRYYILSRTSHIKEIDFDWEAYYEKVNNELIGILGNFIHRIFSFSYDNFKEIPIGILDSIVMDKIKETVEKIKSYINDLGFKEISDTIIQLASFGNEYFQKNEPWKLIKSDKEKVKNILYNGLQIIHALSILLEPILPQKAKELSEKIGLENNNQNLTFDDSLTPCSKPIKLTEKPEILFVRLEKTQIDKVKNMFMERIKNLSEKYPKIHELVTYEDFKKLDIRTGQIKKVKNVPNSKNLLLLSVQIGEKIQNIVAKIGKEYKPEDLQDKIIIVITNLEPKKIQGVESKGMLLAADLDGKAIILTTDRDVPSGVKVT